MNMTPKELIKLGLITITIPLWFPFLFIGLFVASLDIYLTRKEEEKRSKK